MEWLAARRMSGGTPVSINMWPTRMAGNLLILLQLVLTLNIIAAACQNSFFCILSCLFLSHPIIQDKEYKKKEFWDAAAIIFSVKTSCSSINKFPAIRVGHIFMETGVHLFEMSSLAPCCTFRHTSQYLRTVQVTMLNNLIIPRLCFHIKIL
jgi:hypothetical protein